MSARIAELDKYLAWMRKNGVIRLSVGEVELMLGIDSFTGEPEDYSQVGSTTLSVMESPYEDPDLYPDGKVPRIRGKK